MRVCLSENLCACVCGSRGATSIVIRVGVCWDVVCLAIDSIYRACTYDTRKRLANWQLRHLDLARFSTLLII